MSGPDAWPFKSPHHAWAVLISAVLIVVSVFAFRHYAGRERTFVAGNLTKLPIHLTRLIGRYEWIDSETVFYLRHKSPNGLLPIFCRTDRWPPAETNFLTPLFRTAGSEYNYSSVQRFLPKHSLLVMTVVTNSESVVYIANVTNETISLSPSPAGEVYETSDGDVFYVEKKVKKPKRFYTVRNAANEIVKTLEEDDYAVGFDYKKRFVFAIIKTNERGFEELKLTFYPLTAEPHESSTFEFPAGSDISDAELSHDGSKFVIS